MGIEVEVAAAIGLAAGAGLYLVSVVTTALVLIVLFLPPSHPMTVYLRLNFLISPKKGMRSFIKGSLKGLRPFKDLSLPLSLEGEGDKGDEVDK